MVTQYAKPAVRSAWGDTATANDLQDPGNSTVSTGWQQSTTPPARQYFNWVLNWDSASIRYFCQVGVVDYDAAELYQTGAVVRYTDGLLYRSLQNTNTGNAPEAGSAWWGSILTVSPAAGDNSNSIATTAWISAGFTATGPITASALTATGAVNAASVTASGAIQGATLDATSDKRLKKCIRPIKGALEKLDLFFGSAFRWRVNDKPSAGIIAQDFRRAMPEGVRERADGNLAVDPMAAIAFLTEALREERDARRALERRLTTIEACR